MVNKLLNAQLSAVFSQDPTISLKNYLSTNWATVTGYSPPAAAAIKFDTKFGSFTGFNLVIIEEMPKSVESQIVGKGRTRVTETKRLQIWCRGSSAKNNRYLMEKHIDSLINSNPTGLTSDGIDEMHLDDFTEIPQITDDEINKAQPQRQEVWRSRATVRLVYDLYVTAA